MIIKECTYSPINERGEQVIHFIRPGADKNELIKLAAPLLPKVAKFVENIKPSEDKVYILVNALGAGEYWGPNVNADYFSEAALCHSGSDYGYMTFYDAYPYRHHQNKDPEKAFGEVLLSCWHPLMKRVELVIALDRQKALMNGAQGIMDKIDAGQFPSVSMGARVAYDLCSICYDRKKYREAEATFNPVHHRSISHAVVEFHKKNPIEGLSRTRNDYCIHMKTEKNRIYPDGRKVFVFNPYPKFFDISFVFIGADKTAFMMGKLASGKRSNNEFDVLWKSAREEPVFHATQEFFKTASIERDDEAIRSTLWGGHGKFAELGKEGEIVKNVTSHFVGKTLPALERKEKAIPKKILRLISKNLPLNKVLSGVACTGIILRPSEFQRIVLSNLGQDDLADELEDNGIVFKKTTHCTPGLDLPASSRGASRVISSLLPMLPERSIFPPFLLRRAAKTIQLPINGMGSSPLGILGGFGGSPKKDISITIIKIGDGILDNISGLYNTYRQQQLTKLALFGQEAASNYPLSSEISKDAASSPGLLPAAYAANYYGQEEFE